MDKITSWYSWYDISIRNDSQYFNIAKPSQVADVVDQQEMLFQEDTCFFFAKNAGGCASSSLLGQQIGKVEPCWTRSTIIKHSTVANIPGDTTNQETNTHKQTNPPTKHPITSTNIFSGKIRPWNWGASHGIFGKPDRPGFGGLDCGELLYWKHHFPWLLLHPGRGTFRFWAPLSWEVGWLVQRLETSPSPEKITWRLKVSYFIIFLYSI